MNKLVNYFAKKKKINSENKFQSVPKATSGNYNSFSGTPSKPEVQRTNDTGTSSRKLATSQDLSAALPPKFTREEKQEIFGTMKKVQGTKQFDILLEQLAEHAEVTGTLGLDIEIEEEELNSVESMSDQEDAEEAEKVDKQETEKPQEVKYRKYKQWRGTIRLKDSQKDVTREEEGSFDFSTVRIKDCDTSESEDDDEDEEGSFDFSTVKVKEEDDGAMDFSTVKMKDDGDDNAMDFSTVKVNGDAEEVNFSTVVVKEASPLEVRTASKSKEDKRVGLKNRPSKKKKPSRRKKKGSRIHKHNNSSTSSNSIDASKKSSSSAITSTSNSNSSSDSPDFLKQYREPEEWELNILALEKGECRAEMDVENSPFKRWKKERPNLPSIYMKK